MIKALKKLKNWHRRKKERRTTASQTPSQFQPPIAVPTQPKLSPALHRYRRGSTSIGPKKPLLRGRICDMGRFLLPHRVCFRPQMRSQQRLLLCLLPLFCLSPHPINNIAPDPVCGVPIMPSASSAAPAASGGRSGGLFGCVISIGSFLIRFLSQCFRFRD